MSLSYHPLYGTWESMKARCYNKNNVKYNNYGGRGIKVCNQWVNSFATFLKDMGERPSGLTLDRKDNDGNYKPSNCRWADGTTQNINQRMNSKNTTGVRGVSFTKLTGRYECYINYKYKRYHIGHFDTLEEAKAARLLAEKRYWR